MMRLEDIRKDEDLLNAIDWEMTPEEAVRLYLEWGNNWANRKTYVIRSKDDVCHYFVVNTWGEKPRIFFIRRNSEEARELAEIEMPPALQERFLASVGHNKGVYAVDGEVRNWLKSQLYCS
ncbi:MAG: DVU0772 family protein [Desulfobacterales bacterium]